MQTHVGDVFSLPLTDHEWSFGHVLAYRDPVFLMAAFDLRSLPPMPSIESIIMQPRVFVGTFFGTLIQNQRWKVLGNATPEDDHIPFPKHKVLIDGAYYVETWDRTKSRLAVISEVELLPNPRNYGPIILENAVKWHFGLHQWEDAFSYIQLSTVKEWAAVAI